MSTNIQNGFYFEGDILELQKELKELRKAFYKLSDLLMKKKFVQVLYRVFDLANYMKKDELAKYLDLKEDEKLFFFASKELKRYQETSYYNTQIIIYPKEKDLFYGVAFISREFGDFVKLSKKIKEYGYWNSTDRPNEISEEEWSEREKTWNEIFSEENVFSEAGFSFRMAKTVANYLPSDFEKEDLVLTKEEREKKLEFELRILKRYQEETDENSYEIKELIDCELDLMFSNLDEIYKFLEEKKDN